MSTIRYKNSSNIFITFQQAQLLEEYSKGYYDGDLLIREEIFRQGLIREEYIHNHDNQTHGILITNYPDAIIIDHLRYSNGCRLEKAYGYNDGGVLINRAHTLYDTNDKIIGHEVILDDDGGAIYQRKKSYWDLNVNPDKEIFTVVYYPDINTVEGVHFNQEHENNSGQDAYTLGSDQIDEVIALTGVSVELAQYYFSPEVVPTWS
jgi:antitoxin component YwqK of YwqJK toxin-antitoxin module